MDKNRSFIILAGAFLISISVPMVQTLITTENPELPTKHIIENVPFMPQIVAECTISALRMQLAYYGAVYSQTFLLNLSGWDYVFKYVPNELVFVSVEPVQTVLYIGEILGCKIEHYKNQTFEDAWRTLREFIAQDKPVFIQWRTHSLLAVGYDDEDNLVYLNNPAGGPAGAYLERENFGAYVPMSLETFENYWAISPRGNRYEMLVVVPPKVKPTVSWSEVLTVNAGYLDVGTWDMKAFANALETGFGLTGENLRRRLGEIASVTFATGWIFRQDAAAFIEGLAQMTGSKNLDDASIYLRSTAECFAEGKALLENKLRVGEIPDLPRVAEALRRAADYQEKAGESLMKGAKDLEIETQRNYALIGYVVLATLTVVIVLVFLRKRLRFFFGSHLFH